VLEIAAELTCAEFATWRHLPAPDCQVCVPKIEVLVVYCPSLIFLDAISIPTYQSNAAKSITSLKLLIETTLCSCNKLFWKTIPLLQFGVLT
jgi:hypothetical protein